MGVKLINPGSLDEGIALHSSGNNERASIFFECLPSIRQGITSGIVKAIPGWQVSDCGSGSSVVKVVPPPIEGAPPSYQEWMAANDLMAQSVSPANSQVDMAIPVPPPVSFFYSQPVTADIQVSESIPSNNR